MGRGYDDRPDDEQPPYDDGYGDHVRKVCACDVCMFGRNMDAADFALGVAKFLIAVQQQRALTDEEQKLYSEAVKSIPLAFPKPPTGTDHRRGKA